MLDLVTGGDAKGYCLNDLLSPRVGQMPWIVFFCRGNILYYIIFEEWKWHKVIGVVLFSVDRPSPFLSFFFSAASSIILVHHLLVPFFFFLYFVIGRLFLSCWHSFLLSFLFMAILSVSFTFFLSFSLLPFLSSVLFLIGHLLFSSLFSFISSFRSSFKFHGYPSLPSLSLLLLRLALPFSLLALLLPSFLPVF